MARIVAEWQGEPPPSIYGGNGVTQPDDRANRAGIDWLSYSVPWPAELERMPADGAAAYFILRRSLPPADSLVVSEDFLAPTRGYDSAIRTNFARLFWHSRNKAQHIGVLMSGSEIGMAVSVGVTQIEMVKHAIRVAKKISRLDFAIDCYHPEARPIDLMTHYLAGHAVTPAREASEMRSYSYAQDVAETGEGVYFGARMSQRQLRVYDKSMQVGVGFPWTRIELQSRDEQARALAFAMGGSGIAEAGQQALRSFFKAPRCKWYSEAVEGPVVPIAPVQRSETNSERWLRDVAVPSVIRAVRDRAAANDWTLYNTVTEKLIAISHALRTRPD